jgi:hypothetical protein
MGVRTHVLPEVREFITCHRSSILSRRAWRVAALDKNFTRKCVLSHLILRILNSESEELLAVGCTRFCVLYYVIPPRVPQRAPLSTRLPQHPPHFSSAPDLSPLSVQSQCRCPGNPRAQLVVARVIARVYLSPASPVEASSTVAYQTMIPPKRRPSTPVTPLVIPPLKRAKRALSTERRRDRFRDSKQRLTCTDTILQ